MDKIRFFYFYFATKYQDTIPRYLNFIIKSNNCVITKCLDFATVFLFKLEIELRKNIGIKNFIIKIKKDQ